MKTLLGLLTLLFALPAYAHAGPHAAQVVAAVLHKLLDPGHLGLVTAAFVFSAIVLWLARRVAYLSLQGDDHGSR
jgi:hypothetical protein